MVSRKVSSEARAEALDMLVAGHSVTEVASHYGVAESTVRTWRSRSGAATPRTSNTKAPEAAPFVEPRPGSPARLHTLVVAQQINPPTVALKQLLPFADLAWENFERLCLRLAAACGAVEYSAEHPEPRAEGSTSVASARLYGTRGQAQQGIDLYALLPDVNTGTQTPGEAGRYLTVQARRIESLTATKLKGAVDDFLAGSWADASRVFAYAVSLPAVRTELADEIRAQASRLKDNGIDFEVWDGESLSLRLKNEPLIVHDFFGRAWAEHFCPGYNAASLRTRLDAAQVGALRERLASFYATLFTATDSGAAALRSAEAPHLGLRERFIAPDVMLGPQLSAGAPAPVDDLNAAYAGAAAHSGLYPRFTTRQLQRTQALGGQPEVGVRLHDGADGGISRAGIDTWLASDQYLLLVGEPGAGKSTVLRYALLDLLSEAPSLERCAQRFGDRLPVWLPFHFLTRRKAQYTGEAASLSATLKAWFEQQDEAGLWELVGPALDDDRLLLIVDGLDEWIDEGAGLLALKALEVFITQRGLPALVSSRPFGLTRLQLGNQWRQATLASLSDDQQRALARLWFGAEHGYPSIAPPGPDPTLGHLERTVGDFFTELQQVPELRRLAGIPLFLLALIGLRLAGVSLPSRRFDVYQLVVDRLLREHPALRAAAASGTPGQTTRPARLSQDDVRYVLAHVAHAHQVRGEFGPVEESAVRRDVIAALKDPDRCAMGQESAAAAAGVFLEMAEGELGVLVRQGPRSVGFLHRVLLEQLAAEHLGQFGLDHQREALLEHATDPRWQEVLLGTLWRIARPVEMAQLTKALAGLANGGDPSALAARELLARVVFGGFRMPAPLARAYAEEILSVAETHPQLAHRERLLDAAVPGLGDSAVGTVLRERLTRWAICTPPEPGALFALGEACPDDALASPVAPRLLAALGGEDLEAVHAAALALAARYGGDTRDQKVRDTLIKALGAAAHADHAAQILASLAVGWADDPAVSGLIGVARTTQATSLRLTALAAVLGLLGASPSTVAPVLTREEVEWLFGLLAFERHVGERRRFLSAVLVAAGRRDHDVAERIRTRCLQILHSGVRTEGDRRVAWEVLLTGHALHPDVIAYVRTLITGESNILIYLGWGLLGAAYPGHPEMAQAVELYVQRRNMLEFQLEPLAAIDQGPVMREKLLRLLAESTIPFWASQILSLHWPDDEEVTQALRTAVAGEPERACLVANAAEHVLGPRAAIDRLLEILAAVRASSQPTRPDLAAAALVEAYQHLETPDDALAERIATACFDALDEREYPSSATAQAILIARMASTDAVTSRVDALLEQPHPPITALITGFADNPAVLAKVLEALDAVQPTQPAAVRRHLCLLLRDAAGDGPAVREITARWYLEPDDLARSAASAAFHTHLRRDRDEGRSTQAEWDHALETIREQAGARGLDPRGSADLYYRRIGAWLGALLLDEVTMLADMTDPFDGSLVSLPLSDILTGVDMIALGALAEHWPQVREAFGESMLGRFTDDRFSGSPQEHADQSWEALAAIADRQPHLARLLEEAVIARPELLTRDAVLAWYASAHRGQPHLLDTLIEHIDTVATNTRPLASMLLADPGALDLDAEHVRARLRQELEPYAAGMVFSSGALEALAEGFPDDGLVAAHWQAVCDLRRRHGKARISLRTYLPLAYAAVEAGGLQAQMAEDARRLHFGEDGYYDNLFIRAVVQRLRRDQDARAAIEAAVCDTSVTDGAAAQLAGYLAAAHPLTQKVADSVAARLTAHLTRAEAQPTLEYTPVSGDSVVVALLSVLDATGPEWTR